jgi:thiamine phosphate synthase YjbQ (UPF0047 family)
MTRGRGLVDITDQVYRWSMAEGLITGLLNHLGPAHLSLPVGAGERIAGRPGRLEAFLHRLVPDGGDGAYRHEDEEPDDMPAHIRAALTQTQFSNPAAISGQCSATPGRESISGSTGPARTSANLCCLFLG